VNLGQGKRQHEPDAMQAEIPFDELGKLNRVTYDIYVKSVFGRQRKPKSKQTPHQVLRCTPS